MSGWTGYREWWKLKKPGDKLGGLELGDWYPLSDTWIDFYNATLLQACGNDENDKIVYIKKTLIQLKDAKAMFVIWHKIKQRLKNIVSDI